MITKFNNSFQMSRFAQAKDEKGREPSWVAAFGAVTGPVPTDSEAFAAAIW
jgi:hypothetical protein